MYTALDLNFPFARSFASFIMKRDYDLVAKLGEFAGMIKYRYPTSKLSIIIGKLSDVYALLQPGFNMIEKSKKAANDLIECDKMFAELLRTTDLFQPDFIGFWKYSTGLRTDKILDYYYEFLLRMKVTVYQMKNDWTMEFQCEMQRLNWNLMNRLMTKIDTVYFIINYMMILMQNRWNVFKMFKQYHYCLSVCQKLLDGTPENKDGLILMQGYLHFAWVFYVGRLLDYSNQIQNSQIQFDNTCITFDAEIEGLAPRFIMPSQPITTKEEFVHLQTNLQTLEKDLIYWGNWYICGTLDAVEVLERVKKYAQEMKFD